MTTANPGVAFLDLPAEIRLHIISYAVDQGPEASLKRNLMSVPIKKGQAPRYRLVQDASYRASSNLALLLVCRQFRNDFSPLAWRSTTFYIEMATSEVFYRVPADILRRVRRLAVDMEWEHIKSWNAYPFNCEHLHLDHFTLTSCYTFSDQEAGQLLNRLTNMKAFKVLQNRFNPWTHARQYHSTVLAFLETNHHGRFKPRVEDQDAPVLEASWWEWSYNDRDMSWTFKAQKAMPVMDEKEYMRLVQPLIDKAQRALKLLTYPDLGLAG